MIIELGYWRFKLAEFVARQRQDYNRSNHARLTYNDDGAGDRDVDQLDGALGELATSIALNLLWPGVIGDYDAADIGDLRGGGAIESRSTPRPGGRLIIHPRPGDSRLREKQRGDKPGLPYVLAWTDRAHAHPHIVELRGWIFPETAWARNDWWIDPTKRNRPAYFVDHAALRLMDDLCDLRFRRIINAAAE